MRLIKSIKGQLRTNLRRKWRKSHAKKQGYICYYCTNKLTENNTTLDHLVPLSRGGRDHYENTCAACRKCNNKKADKTIREWIKDATK